MLIYSVLVDAQGWEGSFLYVFVDRASFIDGWMISVAEHAFNIFRSFFSRALLGEMVTSALYTPGAMVPIGLGMSISLAFTALRYGSLWSWRFEFHFGVI
jgi:hypothetical protein